MSTQKRRHFPESFKRQAVARVASGGLPIARVAAVPMGDMVDQTAAIEADQAGTVELIREFREHWQEPETIGIGGALCCLSGALDRGLDNAADIIM